eukprot:Gb_40267 [translate_table: standard]
MLISLGWAHSYAHREIYAANAVAAPYNWLNVQDGSPATAINWFSSVSSSRVACSSCLQLCIMVPPLLRYGKYCGIFYSGCPGEVPCDGLDACCQTHDDCVGHSKYLNVTCNQSLLDCVDAFQSSGQPPFDGNSCDIGTVEDTIYWAIQAGVWIGEGIGDGSSP